jgi:hypothetical protein
MRKESAGKMGRLVLLSLALAAVFAAVPPASAGPSCLQRCVTEFQVCNSVHPAPPPGECLKLYDLCLANCSS